MKKCPKCGYEKVIKKINFDTFMDQTIKRVSLKQKEELGYGIPEKSNQKRNKKARKQ